MELIGWILEHTNRGSQNQAVDAEGGVLDFAHFKGVLVVATDPIETRETDQNIQEKKNHPADLPLNEDIFFHGAVVFPVDEAGIVAV